MNCASVLRVFYAAIIAFLLTMKSVLACTPSAGEHYDEFPSENVFVALVEVSEMSAFPAAENEACLSVSYVTSDVIFGEIPEKFAVESCIKEMSVDELLQHEGNSEMGFQKDSTVLIGVVPSEESDGGYRYAVPSCWGPFHVRVDSLRPDERELMMNKIQAEIRRFWSGNSRSE